MIEGVRGWNAGLPRFLTALIFAEHAWTYAEIDLRPHELQRLPLGHGIGPAPVALEL